MTDNPNTIIRASDQRAKGFIFRHPLGGGKSEIAMTMLAQMAGLKRLGVSIGRVPPGKEAFVYHRHHCEEEWVYILEGRAASDIDGAKEEVGPGDFLGYPVGVAHNLENIGQTELVYLMGGEQTSVEIADFPKHGKRLLRAGERIEFIDEKACEPFIPDVRPLPQDE